MKHQRTSLPLTAVLLGGTLFLASALPAAVDLPSPAEWDAPAGAPTAPGDTFPISFASPPRTVDPQAPAIAEWNKTVKPGESFTLTGIRLTSRTGTLAGSDTTVWIWADTPGGGVLTQALVWKVSDSVLTATVPLTIPFGMFLVWVENSYGPSAPVCLNRPEDLWVGPKGNSSQAGASLRLFGKNVARDHGTVTSYVFIQPAGGGALAACAVTAVTPYAVTFTVPASLANGAYNLYLHNGHGGRYGWSDPVPLTLSSAWSRGTGQISVPPSGADDWNALQTAINTLTATTNGGTLVLSPGTYKISKSLGIKQNVRVLGAGKDLTTVEIRMAQPGDGCVLTGNHIAMENLTLKLCQSPSMPVSILTSQYPTYCDDLLLRNLRWMGEPQTGGRTSIWSNRGVVTGCDAFRWLEWLGSDTWVFGNTFHGGVYGGPDVAATSDGGISPTTPSNRTVIENNQFQTDNWPVGPGGSRNYVDFIPVSDLQWKIWCKRMICFTTYKGSSVSAFSANNTSSDVAVQENKGELILLHGSEAFWYGQVSSCNGTTLALRTDGLIDGQTMNIRGRTPGTTLPSGDWPENRPFDNETYALVAGGPGLGQVRKVVSHTGNTVTVDKLWRVEPTSASRITLGYIKKDHVIFNNQLNAFPAGYNQTYSASTGISIDGNGFGCVAEGNVSHRTWSARGIAAEGISQSYWNELRDELAYDVCFAGISFTAWTSANGVFPEDIPALGPFTLGNMIRGGEIQLVGPWNVAYATGLLQTGISTALPFVTSSQTVHLANVFENIVASGGKSGIVEDDVSASLFRNNDITVANVTVKNNNPPEPEPVWLYRNAKPSFSDNYYLNLGGGGTYFKDAQSPLADQPTPLLRVARFAGTSRTTFSPLSLPVANTGIASMSSWTATADQTWIVATPGAAISPDDFGTLTVNVVPAGLSVGVHWGTVTMNGPVGTATVGVRAEISDAPPTGAVFWLKADAGVTANGTLVSAWADQSGSGAAVSQTVSASQPTFLPAGANGKPAIRFDGANDALVGNCTITTSQDTLFIVCSYSDITDREGVFCFLDNTLQDSAADSLLLQQIGTNQSRFLASTSTICQFGNFTPGQWYLFTLRLCGNSIAVSVNGAPFGSFTPGSRTRTWLRCCLGARYWMTGGNSFSASDIAELLLYGRDLSPTERTQAESYLLTKYGIPH